eukprot:145870_1
MVNSVLAIQIIEVMMRMKWVMLCWRWIWDQDLMLRILLQVGSGFDVAQITAGAYHTCALSTSGGVKCFGALLEVDFGSGFDVAQGSGFDVAHITAGWGHTCALSTSGGVKCFGRNDFGQLGLGDSNNRGNEANEMGDALLEVD